jgi:hypothetical protein
MGNRGDRVHLWGFEDVLGRWWVIVGRLKNIRCVRPGIIFGGSPLPAMIVGEVAIKIYSATGYW